MSFREPSQESPHRPFWEHIKAGGRVWRDDRLNGKQEWLDLNSLGGDANKIQRYGYRDLSIPNSECAHLDDSKFGVVESSAAAAPSI